MWGISDFQLLQHKILPHALALKAHRLEVGGALHQLIKDRPYLWLHRQCVCIDVVLPALALAHHTAGHMHLDHSLPGDVGQQVAALNQAVGVQVPGINQQPTVGVLGQF